MPLQLPEAPTEPRVTVAVVAGGGGGPDARARAEAALDGARTLITHLHTAPRAEAAAGAQQIHARQCAWLVEQRCLDRAPYAAPMGKWRHAHGKRPADVPC